MSARRFAMTPQRIARFILQARNRHLLLIDCFTLAAAALLAFALRFESWELHRFRTAVLAYGAAAPFLKIPIFVSLGIYSRFWRFASAEDALTLVVASVVGALVQGAVFLGLLVPLNVISEVPRSIPAIDILITLAVVAGPRFGLRLGMQRVRRWVKASGGQGPEHRVLIAGAGDAGVLVLREIEANPQTGLVPVGFVDDDVAKKGVQLRGYPVLGQRADIPVLVQDYRVDQVIIAMPSAPGHTIREIANICNEAGVQVRIVPGVYEFLAGRINLQQIRNVQIEDLLRREPVQTDTRQVAGLLRGRRVLVTGAGGSIGSELCRQIARSEPAELVLLGHGENSLFLAEAELRRLAPGLRTVTVVADVRDRQRLASIFARYRPEIVFHAAAHKHVPLMECNAEDAITNNVLGTRQLVEVSVATGVGHFVLISTDKAVNPTSVMGATKRVAELIVQQAAVRTGRAFVAVRFGNVLGSRGSVVPYFQQQIANGGPVTVTHPDVRRYFMTIPEAVQLVLQAATLGQGGEVFLLDMGEPVRIADLATDLIRLSGLEPGKDIEVVFTGLRPGEKMFEELFADKEAYSRTEHDKIFMCRNGDSAARVPATLDRAIDLLVAAAQRGEEREVRALLRQLLPEFQPAGQAPASLAMSESPAAGADRADADGREWGPGTTAPRPA